MNPQELKAMETLVGQLEDEQLRRIQNQNALSKMSIAPPNANELNIVTQQLDLSNELDRLYHLINGHVITRDGNGEYWTEPKDDRLKVFSEYGAKQLMNYILFYINKNTLLSNFSIEEINEKMYSFGIELVDLMYTMYEDMFFFPTPEKIYRESLLIIQKQPENFQHLLIYNQDGSVSIDTDKLYRKCLQWSRAELQMKIKHYPMIVLAVTDSIHATMLRALNGEERESLRKYMQIHQSINSNPNPESKGILGGLFGK
jgi:hypothetical protein